MSQTADGEDEDEDDEDDDDDDDDDDDHENTSNRCAGKTIRCMGWDTGKCSSCDNWNDFV